MIAAQRFCRAVRYAPTIKRNEADVNRISTSGRREKTSGIVVPVLNEHVEYLQFLKGLDSVGG